MFGEEEHTVEYADIEEVDGKVLAGVELVIGGERRNDTSQKESHIAVGVRHTPSLLNLVIPNFTVILNRGCCRN